MKRAKGKFHEADTLLGNRDAASMRPFIAKDGNSYVVNFTGGDPKDKNNYVWKRVGNAALRYDEWRVLDDAVIGIAEQRLVGFDDLRANGLVKPLPNAMATTVLTHEKSSDGMEAVLSINPLTRGKGDQIDHTAVHTPMPIAHSDYSIGERFLQESRTRGQGIDVADAERAARKVSVQLEDMLFAATSSFTYGGGTIYTYISHGDINTVTLSVQWNASAITPALIIADVIAMKAANIAAKYYGPYVLYVPTAYETVLDEDYSVSGASMKTIRQRILDIKNIQKVVVVDRLPVHTCVLVTMNKDVVDLVDGMPLQNIQWDSEGGMVHHYKVMTIMVPRVKSDYDGNSGICKLSA